MAPGEDGTSLGLRLGLPRLSARDLPSPRPLGRRLRWKSVVNYEGNRFSRTMKCRLSALALALLGAAQGAFALTAEHFIDAAAFQAWLQSSGTPVTFEDLGYGDLGSSLLTFSSGAYLFEASTGTGNLAGYSGAVDSSYLTTVETTSLTLTFTGDAPTAVGGYFFGSSSDDTFVFGKFSILINDTSDYSFAITEGETTPYLGLTIDGVTPITRLVFSTTTEGAYVGVDDFTAGQAVIPEPSTYGLLAGGLMLGFALWRRRQ